MPRFRRQDGEVKRQPPRKRYGLGSMIAAVTDAVGIEKCGGCGDREETLNQATDKAAEALGVKDKDQ